MPENPLSAPNRCAIYTRKSTNSRLDHEVNSLTTQHEICSAYVASQRYRGWTALPRSYDDGGHSGSGLERPALAALMHDIEAGEIDTVVVYKIDRLTRSLLDFVRLIEIFDRRSIGLVSVSQAFDTTDSMGRMILNVLLTFSHVNRRAKLTPYRRPILTPPFGSAAVIPVVDRRGPRTTTRTVRCAGGGVRGRSLLTHRVNRRGWGSGGRGFGLSSGF